MKNVVMIVTPPVSLINVEGSDHQREGIMPLSVEKLDYISYLV